ncbi:nitrite reductase (NADH) small subunit [Palleronia aestuarii]|uniref:Nitrite reductase (NADH) small subunit n=1 Tax=Palleronia aestuarii TaxID=568105 RepID=A0A2W7N746_9RHOB|nr:nitrite reductase small subunit NirD [Palleronia aestuarii]PZX15941.1 nitrite reductase (NADH) small subunit [Palleronia aestuarii]
MSWIDIGALGDVPVRGARLVKTHAGCIALFRTTETEIFATSNTCAHKGGPLSEGIVHDRKVTCPLHNWVWSLETGEAQGADQGRIATYPVRIEDGRILIDGDAIDRRSAA